MKRLLIICAFSALAFGPQQTSKIADQDSEMAIRAADEAWAKAIGMKSIEETVAVYDPEAVTAGAAMPPAKGVSAVRAMWTKLFADPGFSLTWKSESIVVTESQTMAYSTGTWHIGPATGPYLAVWRKQPDGKWKVLIDSAWYSQKP
jgi:ketosteroid isomerase-like protein